MKKLYQYLLDNSKYIYVLMIIILITFITLTQTGVL